MSLSLCDASGTSLELTGIVRAIETPLTGKISVFLYGSFRKRLRLAERPTYGMAALTGNNPLSMYGDRGSRSWETIIPSYCVSSESKAQRAL